MVTPESVQARWALHHVETLQDWATYGTRMVPDKQFRSDIEGWRLALVEGVIEEEDIPLEREGAPWKESSLWRWNWLHWSVQSWHFIQPFLWCACLTVFAGITCMLRRQKPVFLIPLAVLAGQAVVVFLRAPLFRYMGVSLWLAVIVLLAFLLHTWRKQMGVWLVMGLWVGQLFVYMPERIVERLSEPLVHGWGFPPPQPVLETFTSDYGVSWGYHQTDTDDAPVPNGKYRLPMLRYLDPEKGIRGGVYVEK